MTYAESLDKVIYLEAAQVLDSIRNVSSVPATATTSGQMINKSPLKLMPFFEKVDNLRISGTTTAAATTASDINALMMSNHHPVDNTRQLTESEIDPLLETSSSSIIDTTLSCSNNNDDDDDDKQTSSTKSQLIKTNNDDDLLDVRINNSAVDNDDDKINNDDDQSLIQLPSNATKMITGLLGHQLYRCAFCNLSYGNVKSFKEHCLMSKTCRLDASENSKQFKCCHCERLCKTPDRLIGHLQIHGPLRFSCSLCTRKFSGAFALRLVKKLTNNN